MLLLEGKALESFVVCPESSLRAVVAGLDGSSQGICLVVCNSTNQLLGTITDGDIRRYMLSNSHLDGDARSVANQNPISAPIGFANDQYKQICTVNSIRHLPILRSDLSVQGLFLLTGKSEEVSDCRLVVMAGGKGTRLRPLTNECPKPMLKIGGKPILERIIRKAQQEGLSKITISVNYLKEKIIDYIGDGTWLGVSVSYLEEDEPLGTAGALGSLMSSEQSIIITNGDVLTDVNYMDICDYHRLNKSTATMAVKRNEWASPYGVVETTGIKMIGFKEKPIYHYYINAGIYVVESLALGILERGQHCDMPSLFEQLRCNGDKTIVYPMHEPWIDVGRPAELEEAQKIIGNI